MANNDKRLMSYTRLKVDKNRAGDVMLVVCLIEEHVLAVAAFCRPFFKNTFFADAMFSTQLLPIDRTHFHGSLESDSS